MRSAGLHTPPVVVSCCLRLAGEAALKSAQLELQLQTRKQEAEIEMVQTKLQQQAATLVSSSGTQRHLEQGRGAGCSAIIGSWSRVQPAVQLVESLAFLLVSCWEGRP